MSKPETSMQAYFLKKTDVLRRIGMSHAWLYKRMKDNEFVRPVKLKKASLWPSSEIDLMCQAMAAGLDGEELKRLVARIEADRKKFLEG